MMRIGTMIEPKKMLKKRGLSSPDHADQFVMTFAYPVASLPGPGEHMSQDYEVLDNDFDPYE